MGPAHYKDLRELYTKRMETHGLGVALFHPIAAEDMRPPCCGYFDRNGDWNLICNLLPESRPPYHPTCAELGHVPLEYTPSQSVSINIEWQPKTASGTQEHVMAASADTPDNQPAGAEANVQYTSNSKFGAVLMTKKPITLTAYNDERLFKAWLEANRGELYKLHGSELKKYGMWLVTRTYTSRGASINAWSDANKASVISTKAKAAMLGELGEDLNWQDRLASRDWSHYASKSKEGLVVFMDGVDMSPMEWKFEGLKQNLPGATSRNDDDRVESKQRAEELSRRRSVGGRYSTITPNKPNGSATAPAAAANDSNTNLTPVTDGSEMTPVGPTKPPTWALDQVKSMQQTEAAPTNEASANSSKDKPSPPNPRKSSTPDGSQSQRRPSPQAQPSPDDPWWYEDGGTHPSSNGKAPESSHSKPRAASDTPRLSTASPLALRNRRDSSPESQPEEDRSMFHNDRDANGKAPPSSSKSADVPMLSADLPAPPRSQSQRRTPSPRALNSDKRSTWYSNGGGGLNISGAAANGVDEDVLRDTGLLQPLARSITPLTQAVSSTASTFTKTPSPSMASTMPKAPSPSSVSSLSTAPLARTPSLRRETRSISRELEGGK